MAILEQIEAKFIVFEIFASNYSHSSLQCVLCFLSVLGIQHFQTDLFQCREQGCLWPFLIKRMVRACVGKFSL